MTRYTVVYAPDALSELADIWLESGERGAVAEAADAIDSALAEDAPDKGESVESSIRKLIVQPLVAYFVVSPEDRLATIWSVRINR